MAKLFGAELTPVRIIRFLLVAIIIMIALLFAKYVYLPKKNVLKEIEDNIVRLENKKREVSRQVVEARTKLELKKKKSVKVDEIENREDLGTIPKQQGMTDMDKLLADMFTLGDTEQVNLLHIKTGNKDRGFTPIEFSVRGQFFNTLRFLEQVATLGGVSGVSQVKIEDSSVEIGNYVVTTTFSMPITLIE